MNFVLWKSGYFYILINILELFYGTQLNYWEIVWSLWILLLGVIIWNQSSVNQGMTITYFWGKKLLCNLPNPPWIMFSSWMVGTSIFPSVVWVSSTSPLGQFFPRLRKISYTCTDPYSAENWRRIFHRCPLSLYVLLPFWCSCLGIQSAWSPGILVPPPLIREFSELYPGYFFLVL